MTSVTIIGVGRVGGAIALALDRKGYVIDNLIVRNAIKDSKIVEGLTSEPTICSLSEIEQLKSDIVFIATQDSEIVDVVGNLKRKILKKNTSVFHTSGSVASDVLSDLRAVGINIGSIHPLVSISDPLLGIERFRNSFFCVEGVDESVQIARNVVQDLGGNFFKINSKYKSLYHASAVMACGHIVALIDASMEMLQKCGLDSDSSKEILMPLIKSTIENLAQQRNSEALTGTFARADVGTFEKHTEIIGKTMDEDILELYLNLGVRSMKLAKEQGIEAGQYNKMMEKISLAKKNLKC